MKKNITVVSLLLAAAVLCSCSDKNQPSSAVDTVKATDALAADADSTEPPQETTEQGTAPPLEVGYEGMEPIAADKLNEGEYDIAVDSSSSMFNITQCILTVSEGKMTAKMTMSGSGYEYLFMGTGEEAANADESGYIHAEEADDTVSFIVPVEALDKVTDCAAFSKRKEQWYDRKLVFRGDSLPVEAWAEDAFTTAQSLKLADGEYTVSAELEGGSGKSGIQSPARLFVRDGEAFAEIVWSSNNFDYMVVDGERILPVSIEEYSVFEIPVIGFDYKMSVSADTTAMSTPHEIQYTIYFDSSTITE